MSSSVRLLWMDGGSSAAHTKILENNDKRDEAKRAARSTQRGARQPQKQYEKCLFPGELVALCVELGPVQRYPFLFHPRALRRDLPGQALHTRTITSHRTKPHQGKDRKLSKRLKLMRGNEMKIRFMRSLPFLLRLRVLCPGPGHSSVFISSSSSSPELRSSFLMTINMHGKLSSSYPQQHARKGPPSSESFER